MIAWSLTMSGGMECPRRGRTASRGLPGPPIASAYSRQLGMALRIERDGQGHGQVTHDFREALLAPALLGEPPREVPELAAPGLLVVRRLRRLRTVQDRLPGLLCEDVDAEPGALIADEGRLRGADRADLPLALATEGAPDVAGLVCADCTNLTLVHTSLLAPWLRRPSPRPCAPNPRQMADRRNVRQRRHMRTEL